MSIIGDVLDSVGDVLDSVRFHRAETDYSGATLAAPIRAALGPNLGHFHDIVGFVVDPEFTKGPAPARLPNTWRHVPRDRVAGRCRPLARQPWPVRAVRRRDA